MNNGTNEHIIHTTAGVILTMIYNWGADILHTLVLAFVGASVSFLTSVIWKWVFKKRTNRKFKSEQ